MPLVGSSALVSQVLQLPIVKHRLKRMLNNAVKKLAMVGAPIIPSSDESLEQFLNQAGQFFGKDSSQWEQMGESHGRAWGRASDIAAASLQIVACTHACCFKADAACNCAWAFPDWRIGSCMHVCTHACTHAFLYLHVRLCMHACMRTYVHTCKETCAHTYKHACIHACASACMRVCVRASVAHTAPAVTQHSQVVHLGRAIVHHLGQTMVTLPPSSIHQNGSGIGPLPCVCSIQFCANVSRT
eukprot:364524-Chlamydomonas_euryale.AAC.10